MGAAYECPESAGRGSDPERAHQQLSLDLTPSPETKNIIERTEEAASEEPAAFSVGEVHSADSEPEDRAADQPEELRKDYHLEMGCALL